MSIDMSQPVVDATDADFQRVVIDESQQVPVLVDFWAPWCGPCKVIGPVLEKLAAEAAGTFKLVKVNMDENPMLAQALMIQSIPAVKLFINGAIKDEFLGAFPEPEIRKFLEKNLPSASDQGAESGLQQFAEGEKGKALEMFQQALQEDPDNAVALIGMGNYQFEEGNLEEARAAVARVSEFDLDNLVDKANAEKALAGLRAKLFLRDSLDACADTGGGEVGGGDAGGGEVGGGDAGGGETAEDLNSRLRRGCELALEGAYEASLEALISIVREDRKFMDDIGRKSMVAVFDLLPNDSELTYAYRNQLSSLLFS